MGLNIAIKRVNRSRYSTDVRQMCRIEEIYHRLSIGDALERIPGLWFSKARLGLARAVDELEDVAGRGTLKVLLGRVPTREELDALPASVKREYATRRLGAAIRLPDPEQALVVLSEYSEYLPADVRQWAEPRAADLSGQWGKAQSLFSSLVVGKDLVGNLPSLDDALAAADFFERDGASEIFREMTIHLLGKLRGKLRESSESRKWAMPLGLAELRLRVRQDASTGPLSIKDVEAVTKPQALQSSNTLSSDLQWILILSGFKETELRLIPRITVTVDTVRGQLAYVRQLLDEGKKNSKQNEIAIGVCEELSRNGIIPRRNLSDPETWRFVVLVLRHVLRPYTPQWYVPLASLLLRHSGGVVTSADLYLESLPQLPFKTTAVFKKTSALADFLGRLDQLGVLHTCLQMHLGRRDVSIHDVISEILDAYLSWRRDFLHEVDEWFASFPQVRALGLGPDSNRRARRMRKESSRRPT